MHEGPGPERGLAAAMTAFVGPSLGLQPPGLVVAAGGAAEPVGPADRRQVGRARGFVRKAALKGDQRARKVRHDQTPEYTLTAPPNCPTNWDHLI
jgi:hypothetical protein